MIPTPRLLFLLLLGAVVVTGASLARPLVWLAVVYFVALLGLVVADYVISTKPDQLGVRRINEPKLSLGAPNLIALAISNDSPRTVRFKLRDEYPYQFRADRDLLEGALPPLDTAEQRYHVTPVQRGDYTWGDSNLRYRSTLGLFVRQVRYPTAAGVRVYPNVLDVRKYDLLARKGLLTELGLRNAKVFGSGSEFERLRDYTPDDEFKRINWKATARRNKLIAIEHETERSQHVICVLDTGRLMRPPIGDIQKLDYAINAALLTSYVATLRGDQIGMLTFADEVGVYLAPRKGRSQFYTMLELLYNVQSEAVEADYGRALGYLSVKNKRRSLIVVFSDLVTLDAAQPLIAYMARLAQHHLPLLVIMNDPNITGIAAQQVGSSSAAYERAVAEQLLDERRVILDTLQRAGVLTLDVPADKLSVAVINKYLELKTRGVL
jgi:uncharacterized protein (DUF58 family)